MQFGSHHAGDRIKGTELKDQHDSGHCDGGYEETRVMLRSDGETEIKHYLNGEILGESQIFTKKVGNFKVFIGLYD